MKHIDDLPVDIWPNIFRNLSIVDLVNCRLVNKKFKDFCDFTDGIYRLSVNKYNFEHDRFWYYNRESINEEDTISYRAFLQIKSLSIFNLDKYLKYLTIDLNQFYFNAEPLSYLTNLEYLAIENLFYSNQNFNFLNLKFLSIGYDANNFISCQITLFTPKLEKLKIDFISNLKFQSNPASVKHIILHGYEDKLKMFTNLEIIEFNYLRNVNPLPFFPKLIKLKIKYNDYVNETRNNLANILNTKKNYNKNIDVYFSDLKITEFQTIEQHDSSYNFSNLKYQLANYDLLDLNVDKKIIQFNDLACSFSNIKDDLPLDFFDKYSNLSRVNVVKRSSLYSRNFDNLNWFLSNLKRKSIALNLYKAYLDQNIYNNLPDVIRKLDITRNIIKLNYNFLLNLTKLNWFETDEQIDLFELVLNLFLKLKYLKHFAFRFNMRKIRIERKNKKFRVLIGSKSAGKGLNYGDLVILFNQIRSSDNQIQFLFN